MRPTGIAAAAIAVGFTLGLAVPGAVATPPPARGSLAISTVSTVPGPGLWRLDLPTHQLTRLTGRGTDASPAWSRDGTRIAFIRAPGTARSRLFVVGRDGHGLHQAGKLALSSASWGPGDRELAIATGRGIWIIAPNGSIHRRLYAPKDGAIYDVAWSPNGRTILFANDGKGIFAIAARGGRARLIIRPPKARGRHFFVLSGPAWAPNGRRFAYMENDVPALLRGPVIRTANADGSGRHSLARVGAKAKAAVGVPTWSPDSRWIAFTDWRGDNEGIFEVPAGGGKPRLLYGGNSGTIWSQPAWGRRGRRAAERHTSRGPSGAEVGERWPDPTA